MRIEEGARCTEKSRRLKKNEESEIILIFRVYDFQWLNIIITSVIM